MAQPLYNDELISMNSGEGGKILAYSIILVSILRYAYNVDAERGNPLPEASGDSWRKAVMHERDSKKN